MSFPKRLKMLRESKGLSQEALADELKMPRPSIAHYESSPDNRPRIPRKDRLEAMAEYFGVSIDFLLGRTETTEYVLTDPERELYNNIEKPVEVLKKYFDFGDATDEDIQKVKEYITFLKSIKK